MEIMIPFKYYPLLPFLQHRFPHFIDFFVSLFSPFLESPIPPLEKVRMKRCPVYIFVILHKKVSENFKFSVIC